MILKYIKGKVINHHFSNSKIEGLTIIDVLGNSISYEKTIQKQNFTIYHELGHIILNHEGSYFTERCTLYKTKFKC